MLALHVFAWAFTVVLIAAGLIAAASQVRDNWRERR